MSRDFQDSMKAEDPSRCIPVVDMGPLVGSGDSAPVAKAIGAAARQWGFFYVVGHGVDETLRRELERSSRAFFAQDLESKLAIAMARGGRAWRGYFPLGSELTLGRPDQKEGLYFGSELPADHPRVAAGLPLHGPNLFPDIPGFRATLLEYLRVLTDLGHTLMQGIALSLGLEAGYFAARYTADPLILFRIFNYPALPESSVPKGAAAPTAWSVAEHTDYGLLTILGQDEAGGLEVRSPAGWVAAPPLPGSFVCNLGDMLERMTGGHYRSTPHRVRNSSGRDRLSFPFFFDPDFEAEVRPIDPHANATQGVHASPSWDGISVHAFQGTYGDYLLNKVSKAFPELGRDLL